jgi:hypothetical protein
MGTNPFPPSLLKGRNRSVPRFCGDKLLGPFEKDPHGPFLAYQSAELLRIGKVCIGNCFFWIPPQAEGI